MKKGKIAIVIFGAVCSGKSTLATKLEKETHFKLINETTTGNYYNIIDSINPLLHPKALYEHCWIYKKYFIFDAIYKKSIFVFLNVKQELLLINYKERLANSHEGDFSKIDPIEQQQLINIEISKFPLNVKKRILTAEIENKEDYDKYLNKIIELADSWK